MKRERIVCLLVLGFVLQGCAPRWISADATTACESQRTLFVVSHGWHTGVVVERKELVKLVPALAGDIGEEGYIEVGWGEERFYRARETSGHGWFYRAEGAFHAFNTCNTWVARVLEKAGPQCEAR
ncbi:MAG: DUF2459 domain-containing protein [Betaproteobacteria bacterium]